MIKVLWFALGIAIGVAVAAFLVFGGYTLGKFSCHLAWASVI